MTNADIQQTNGGAFGRSISLMRMALPATKTAQVSDDRHPAFVYLASLSPGSRRTMRQALDVVAGIVSGGALNAETMDWARLRYQHTQGGTLRTCGALRTVYGL